MNNLILKNKWKLNFLKLILVALLKFYKDDLRILLVSYVLFSVIGWSKASSTKSYKAINVEGCTRKKNENSASPDGTQWILII